MPEPENNPKENKLSKFKKWTKKFNSKSSILSDHETETQANQVPSNSTVHNPISQSRSFPLEFPKFENQPQNSQSLGQIYLNPNNVN